MALIGPSKEIRAFWKERGARDRYIFLLAPDEKVDRESSELYADVVVAKAAERLRERGCEGYRESARLRHAGVKYLKVILMVERGRMPISGSSEVAATLKWRAPFQ